eukprot:TRINITY_DN520_c0_g1_i2.p1 TRINITY_DN520_c0_g1~~TRINITY_DN520_c0_g1_i2.p1  ORF type:complete len:503 (-),score=74.95 TRINITY_DN520_c0_g1_i2:335-1843(-)
MAAATKLLPLPLGLPYPRTMPASTCWMSVLQRNYPTISSNPFFCLGTARTRKCQKFSGGLLRPALQLTYPRCAAEGDTRKASKLKKSGKKVAVEAAGKDDEEVLSATGSANPTATVATTAATSTLPPPADSYPGSPLMWIGVGVALAVAFSWVSKRLQQTMMQQMMKSVMSQTGQRGTPQGSSMFGNQMGMPMPMPFPSSSSPSSSPSWKMPPPPPPSPSASPLSSSPTTTTTATTTSTTASTVTTPASASSTTSPLSDTRPSRSSTSSSSYDKPTSPPKKSVFQDVSVDVVSEAEAVASRVQESSKKSFPEVEVLPFNSRDGRSSSDSNWDSSASSSSSGSQGSTGEPRASGFTVEQLEKMMEDPMVQQMIYPYLPEEMRNPETFKWMMQSPEYRRQLEEMLQTMGGGGQWDSRMGDMFKNFDLNSQEVKQQFDQIGMTPQEVVSKIMANPEVAMAFAKPNIQAAILDCSQNPLNIAKYTNDPEVMKVFTQISELFPGLKT